MDGARSSGKMILIKTRLTTAATPRDIISARTIPISPCLSIKRATIKRIPNSGCPISYNQTEYLIRFVTLVAAAATIRNESGGNANAKRRKTGTISGCLYMLTASHGDIRKKSKPNKSPELNEMPRALMINDLKLEEFFCQNFGAK